MAFQAWHWPQTPERFKLAVSFDPAEMMEHPLNTFAGPSEAAPVAHFNYYHHLIKIKTVCQEGCFKSYVRKKKAQAGWGGLLASINPPHQCHCPVLVKLTPKIGPPAHRGKSGPFIWLNCCWSRMLFSWSCLPLPAVGPRGRLGQDGQGQRHRGREPERTKRGGIMGRVQNQ